MKNTLKNISFLTLTVLLLLTLASCNMHKHVFGDWIEEVKPTCENDGVLGHYHCEECGKDFDGDKNEISSLAIPAKGHTEGDWIIDKEPDCTNNGSRHKVCIDCGKTVKEEVIPATGHKEGKWIVDVEPTCEHEGKRHLVCAMCGKTIKSESFAKCVHDYGKWIEPVAPTKDDEGRIGHFRCKLCGNYFDAEHKEISNIIIPSLGSRGLAYKVNSDGKTCTVTGNGSCYDTEIYISKHIDGYEVTGIGESAFSNCSFITKVHIPSTVKVIDDNAFYGTGLTEITVPATVNKIGVDVFDNCDKLSTVYYNSQYAPKSADYVFFNIPSLKKIVFGGTVIPNYICFESKNLEEAVIGDKVTSIGYLAFNTCTSLADITIPESVSSIKSDAFGACTGLKAVYISDLSKWCKIDFTDGNANPLKFAHNLYLNGKLVTKLVIPETVNTIKEVTFLNCTSIDSVTIHGNVTSIHNYAFAKCTNISDLTLENGLKTVMYGAFKGCTSLLNVTLPDNIETIGREVFEGCTNLSSVTFLGRVKFVEQAFDNCPNLKSVYINDVSKWCSIKFKDYRSNPLYYAKNLYLNGELLTELVIPDSVKSIETFAFLNCKNIGNVTLGNSVKTIGDYAFMGCLKIPKVIIPDSVTTVGIYSFSGCECLTSVTVGKNVKTIENNAFKYCYRLVEVYNLSGLNIQKDSNNYGEISYRALDVYTDINAHSKLWTNADGYVFYEDGEKCILIGYNGNDTDLVLPVDCHGKKYDIHIKAFYDFDNVTSLKIIGGVDTIGRSAFTGCENLLDVKIENDVTVIGDYAFGYCPNLKSVTFGDSVKVIGRSVFEKCTALTDLSMGKSVESIGDEAFSDCNKITSFYVTDSLKSVGYNAFYNCTGLESVYVSDLSVWCKISFGSLEGNPLSCAKKFYVNGKSVTDLIIPDSITTIGEYEFCGFDGFVSVTVGNGVTTIGNFAFADCVNLETLTICSKVTTVGNNAFLNCKKLANVTLPDSVTSLDYGAFQNCVNLKTFKIENSITMLNSSTFENCSSLETLIMGKGVKTVKWNVFTGCANLKTVYYEGTENEWNSISIGSDNNYLTSATRYYYSETAPTTTGNFWHYVDGVPTNW